MLARPRSGRARRYPRLERRRRGQLQLRQLRRVRLFDCGGRRRRNSSHRSRQCRRRRRLRVHHGIGQPHQRHCRRVCCRLSRRRRGRELSRSLAATPRPRLCRSIAATRWGGDVAGWEGDDIIIVEGHGNEVRGGPSSNTLLAYGNSNRLQGGPTDDHIRAEGSFNLLNGGNGAAAASLVSEPRRRRESERTHPSPRNIHVAAAAPPQFVSTEYPRLGRGTHDSRSGDDDISAVGVNNNLNGGPGDDLGGHQTARCLQDERIAGVFQRFIWFNAQATTTSIPTVRTTDFRGQAALTRAPRR